MSKQRNLVKSRCSAIAAASKNHTIVGGSRVKFPRAHVFLEKIGVVASLLKVGPLRLFFEEIKPFFTNLSQFAARTPGNKNAKESEKVIVK